MGNSFALKSYLSLQGRTAKPLSKQENLSRPKGPLIWARGQSRGQLAAVTDIAYRLAEEGDKVTFAFTAPDLTTATIDAETGIILLPDPLEKAATARAFLQHWTPQMLLWLGGPPNPVLTDISTLSSLTCVLVDATAADVYATPGRWLPGARKALFSNFNLAITGDGDAIGALRRVGFGAGQIEPLGMLADSQRVLPSNEIDRVSLGKAIGARPVWLAANCPSCEIDAVLAGHRQALRRSHRLLLILDLADADDGAAVLEQVRAQGLDATLRSDGGEPTDGTQVYIADTTDELGLWYRLAPISYMGGTTLGGTPRHPYEAAALGSVVLHGPRTAPCQAAFLRLQNARASRPMRTAAELGNAVVTLLSPDRAALHAHAAWDVVSSGADVVNRLVELIRDVIDRSAA